MAEKNLRNKLVCHDTDYDDDDENSASRDSDESDCGLSLSSSLLVQSLKDLLLKSSCSSASKDLI